MPFWYPPVAVSIVRNAGDRQPFGYRGPVRARLYSLSLSHPSQAARLMLEHKGLEYELVDTLPGMHPLRLRLAGFRGGTVPALRLDGRRVQGSLRISRALEELRPDPPLFPPDPPRRRRVEEAERWGEAELQPVPRRIVRWGAARTHAVRRWMAADVVGTPAPGLMAAVNLPLARVFARRSGADENRVRADLAALPSALDRVDALLADGVIGGEERNAADYQIATTLRVLLAYPDLAPLLEGRPAATLARRILPSYPEPIPLALPAGWLP
jgi:glutathione S-transferase